MQEETRKPTIVLAMIVKNEAHIIQRCLESVSPYIDTYSIVDTGSTDDTVQIIKKFFKKKHILGRVYRSNFIDFGTNRTECYMLARHCADYILVMDADEIFTINPGCFFKKEWLHHDVYCISNGKGSSSFYFPVLFNSKLVVKYIGRTHEYPDTGNAKQVNLSSVSLIHKADSGTRPEKFQRDIRLLHKDLEENYNTRTLFYLAQSYMGNKQYDVAIQFYKQRIAAGGFTGEVYFSHLMLVNMYLQYENIPQALYHAYQSIEVSPERIEALFEVANYFFNNKEYNQAWHILAMIFNFSGIPALPKDDQFFIDTPVYEYKAEFLYILASYYTGKMDLFRRLNEQFIQKSFVPGEELENYIKYATENTKYYTKNDGETSDN